MDVRPGRLVAHTPPVGGDEWHYLDDHALAVADLAAQFAEPFGGQDIARWLGLLHDAGKAHPDFQNYLWACFREPGRKHSTVDHKSAGAMQIQTIGGEPMMQVLHGHHGGLSDVGELNARINSIIEKEQARTFDALSAYETLGLRMRDTHLKDEVGPPTWFSGDPVEMEFLSRMLFSCLVDADALDTEAHWNAASALLREERMPTLSQLWIRLEQNQRQFDIQNPSRLSDVNLVRAEVYAACLEKAELPPGFFRLTVPTGGGKTRSGLAFAMRHALSRGLRRIVVAVPFVTITDQTARVYRDALGDDRTVLEHHSGIEPAPLDANGGESPQEMWRKLASQNWDAALIVTTTVQLFESLFSNKTSKCRKLHRLAQSVILLDEAQTIPAHLRGPIFDALRELVTHYGATVVLSTATQPVLDTIAEQLDVAGRGVAEIAPEPKRLFRLLRRVRYEWPCVDESWSWERVANEMRSQPQVMAIVNTKPDAVALHTELNDPDAFHLSTRMCGAHRRDVLNDVRTRLQTGQPCRLISTQLVEAGVDLDFPFVMRAIGPLDRIVQAAGRCNREGKLPALGRVVVFSAETDSKMPRGTYRRGADEAKAMLRQGDLDVDDPETFRRYFSLLYGGESDDRPKIQQQRARRNFVTVNDAFHMIDENTFSIYVRYQKQGHGLDNSGTPHDRLLEELRRSETRSGRPIRKLLLRAQPFIVSCRNDRLAEYEANGLIVQIVPGLWEWKGSYNDDLGLNDSRLDPAALLS